VFGYNKAIDINPNLAAAYYNRGLIYPERGEKKYKEGDYDGAIADYTEVINLRPNDDTAYLNRGNARKALKDYEGAIAVLLMVLFLFI